MSDTFYTIRASVGPGGGGHINRAGRILVHPGEDVTITFFPREGYRVSMAEIDGRSAGSVSSATFRDIHEDHTLLVHFAPEEHYSTVSLHWKTTRDGILITGAEAAGPFDLQIPSQIDEQPVLGIADNSFHDNDLLLSFSAEEGVTDIGADAFRGCTSLLRFHLPESLRKIGDRSFMGCSALKEIVLPKSFRGTIGQYAFADCTAAVCANIPEQTAEIENGSFSGDVNLQAVYFNGVNACRKIGSLAFAYCTSLSEIVFPPGLKELAEDALTGSGVRNCYFTGTPFRILPGNAPFTIYHWKNYNKKEGLPSLTGRVVSEEYLDDNHAIGPDGNIYSFEKSENRTAAITGVYLTGSADLRIPDMVHGMPVRSLADKCFKSMGDIILSQRPVMPGTDIRTAIIPDGVTEIGKEAFYACTSLESVEMPDTVTAMGSGVFCNCYNMKHVNLSKALRGVLADIVFWGCLKLERITIPEGVHSIARWTFYNCQSLTRIDFPASICSIDKESFEQCTSLKTVTFPPDSRCTILGQQEFWNDLTLEEISLPPALTFLGVEAFKNASSLKHITIPEHVSSMGAGVFKNCSSLETVEFLGPIPYIDEDSFTGCSCLRTVKLPSGSATSFHKKAFDRMPQILFD